MDTEIKEILNSNITSLARRSPILNKSKTLMSKSKTHLFLLRVLDIGILVIWYCLGFSASCLGFFTRQCFIRVNPQLIRGGEK
jgi:hypothetical protein